MLTGAGISAASGIPTYRDHQGNWRAAKPIQHQEFISSPIKRQRYWARSAVGWPLMAKATPTPAHFALAQLERFGFVDFLVSQNVDRLHQKAGHQSVMDLHGRLDRVKCLDCHQFDSRQSIQTQLIASNPFLSDAEIRPAPDGDAHLTEDIVQSVTIPTCRFCQGVIMPDVVFFGGTVAKEKVSFAKAQLQAADMLLVIGSSLEVYSGFRFVQYAKKYDIPVIVISQGKTRADSFCNKKLTQDSQELLPRVVELLL